MSGRIFGGFALIALLVAGPLQARQTKPDDDSEDGRVVGTVVDDDNNPVAGALVMLGDGRTTESASDGSFSFVRVRAGENEIAAVTRRCEMAAGGFNVESGQAARLQLIVVPQMVAAENVADRASGTPTRRFSSEKLLAMGDHSALQALDELAPNVFVEAGGRLGLRARAISPRGDLIEPLLVVDGVKMSGNVADALRPIRAADLESIDLHLGAAAGWEFQSGGASAVIEITTRNRPVADPFQNPAVCLRRGG
jgi:hypothetical protein